MGLTAALVGHKSKAAQGWQRAMSGTLGAARGLRGRYGSTSEPGLACALRQLSVAGNAAGEHEFTMAVSLITES